MKGNFHVQFGIGGGGGDSIADHTKARVGNHAAREGKATTQKIVIAIQATTMR